MSMFYLMDAAAATGGAVTADSIKSVLDVLGSIFTFLVGQIGSIVDLVMSQPLLLIPIGITLSYVIFRFFRMIFRLAQIYGGVFMSVKSLDDLMDRVGLLLCQINDTDELLTVYLFSNLLIKLKSRAIVNISEHDLLHDSVYQLGVCELINYLLGVFSSSTILLLIFIFKCCNVCLKKEKTIIEEDISKIKPEKAIKKSDFFVSQE